MPVTLVVIFVLLFLTFDSAADALLLMSTVPFALVGGFWLVWALGHAVSVATSVGFIALAGVAAEFGVVMLLYLKGALQRRLDAGEPLTDAVLLDAIREGAVLRVRPKAIYAVLNGAASNFRFVKEFPEAAQYVLDTNHWYDPRNATAIALKKEVDGQGKFFTYNVALNYSAVLLLADAIERAGSADRAKIIAALETSTFAGHIMPYGPTKFVNGQNMGAAPVNTQVQNGDIKVIFPDAFADAKPVFPVPA